MDNKMRSPGVRPGRQPWQQRRYSSASPPPTPNPKPALTKQQHRRKKKFQKSQHRRHTVVNTPGDRQLSTAAWLPRRRPVLRIISSRRSMRVRVVSYNPKYAQKKNFFLHLNFPDHNQTLYKILLLLRTRVSIQSR